MEVLSFWVLHWSLYVGPGGLERIAQAFVKADDTEFWAEKAGLCIIKRHPVQEGTHTHTHTDIPFPPERLAIHSLCDKRPCDSMCVGRVSMCVHGSV